VNEHAQRQTWSAAWRWAWALATVLVLVYLWAGYDEGWAWTGLSRRVTLWDWLEGLALPITVGLVPLMLRHREHLGPPHRAAGAGVLLVFTGLVLAGYLVPWAWTGFTGNTAWDWIQLLLLPLLLPTIVLPRLLAVAEEWMAPSLDGFGDVAPGPR
jgi:hypothetical protein